MLLQDVALTLLLLLPLVLQNVAARMLYLDPSHELKIQPSEDYIYKNLEKAVAALQQGDHLVIAPGVYRGAINLIEKDWRSNEQTTIEASQPGSVLIKGSVIVNDWVARGAGVFVHKGWEINSQQVFVDGKPLNQIGGNVFNGYPDDPDHPLHRLHKGSGIWPGRLDSDFTKAGPKSFYYDASHNGLYIKMNDGFEPNAHEIEVSVVTNPLYAETNWLVVRGLRFEHSNTTARARGGAVTLKGDHNRLENIHVRYADGAGIGIVGNDVSVIDSSANYCGQLGMSARGKRIRLKNVETSYNNTRGFNKWWEAGGAKFVGKMGLQDSLISDHVAVGNNGDGLWFDWGNRDNQIQGCFCAYNSGHGIHYEASSYAYITNNIVIGNGQRGIYLPNSPDCIVAHNLISLNTLGAVVSADTGRRDPEGKLSLRVHKVHIFGNVFAWSAGDRPTVIVGLSKNDNVSDHNLYIEYPQGITRWSLGFRQPFKKYDNWVNETGHDKSSWLLAVPTPAALFQAISKRAKIIEWRTLPALRNITNYRYKIREVVPGLEHASGSQVSPGPLPP